MRITIYKTLLDNDRRPAIVKESATNYTGISSMSSPGEIVMAMNAMFDARNCTEEHIWLIALNNINRAIGIMEISHGSVNASIITPREVFVKLCLLGATNFILVHNHPSGGTNASPEDIETTKRLKQCGELMNIKILDHIIIGEDYLSFCEAKLL